MTSQYTIQTIASTSIVQGSPPTLRSGGWLHAMGSRVACRQAMSVLTMATAREIEADQDHSVPGHIEL